MLMLMEAYNAITCHGVLIGVLAGEVPVPDPVTTGCRHGEGTLVMGLGTARALAGGPDPELAAGTLMRWACRTGRGTRACVGATGPGCGPGVDGEMHNKVP